MSKIDSIRSDREIALVSKSVMYDSLVGAGSAKSDLEETVALLMGSGSTFGDDGCGIYDIYIYLMMQKALLRGTGLYGVCPDSEAIISGTLPSAISNNIESWRMKMFVSPLSTVPFVSSTYRGGILGDSYTGNGVTLGTAPYDFYASASDTEMNTSSTVCVNNDKLSEGTSVISSTWNSIVAILETFYSYDETTKTYTRLSAPVSSFNSILTLLTTYKNDARIVLEKSMQTFYGTVSGYLHSYTTSLGKNLSAYLPTRYGTIDLVDDAITLISNIVSSHISSVPVPAEDWKSAIDGGAVHDFTKGTLYSYTVGRDASECGKLEEMLGIGTTNSLRELFVLLLKMLIGRPTSSLSSVVSTNSSIESMNKKISGLDADMTVLHGSGGTGWLSPPEVPVEYFNGSILHMVYVTLPLFTSMSIRHREISSLNELYLALKSKPDMGTPVVITVSDSTGDLSGRDFPSLQNGISKSSVYLMDAMLTSAISARLDTSIESTSDYSSFKKSISYRSIDSEKILTSESISEDQLLYVEGSDGTSSSLVRVGSCTEDETYVITKVEGTPLGYVVSGVYKIYGMLNSL